MFPVPPLVAGITPCPSPKNSNKLLKNRYHGRLAMPASAIGSRDAGSLVSLGMNGFHVGSDQASGGLYSRHVMIPMTADQKASSARPMLA